MLGNGITLFHVRGIRIGVDWSWLIILFLVITSLSALYGDLPGVSSGSSTAYVYGLITAFGFFGSILLHELGHAFVAIRRGVNISSIQLWIFGGVARMDRDADSAETEFKIAIAGPVVTLAIIVAMSLAGIAIAGLSEFRSAVSDFVDAIFGTTITPDMSPGLAMVAWLASINGLLLVFNLLPAFPMDGGRVARAIAWQRSGDRNSATHFAATLGRGFGYAFVAAGILIVFTAADQAFNGIWLVFIGMMVNGAARSALLQTAISSRIEGMRVIDVMDAEPVAIPEQLSVERALDEYFLRYRWPWFPVVDAAQRFKGLLIRESADGVPELSRGTALVSEHIEPDPGSLHVGLDDPLEALLGNEALRRLGALMAVDADGRLRGVITAEQVGRALREAGTRPVG
jgi:Zn-dependent protease